MANTVYYVDSASATPTSPYDTWAKASHTLVTAIGVGTTTGSDFYVASGHTESAGPLTFTFNGAAATPDRVFSVNKSGSTPPVSGDLTAGATFTSTTTNALTINGMVYIYGCTFQCGASGSPKMTLNNTNVTSDITLDTCKIQMTSGGSTNNLVVGSATANIGSRVRFINTTLKLSSTSAGVTLDGGIFRWENTASAIDGTGSLPTTLFQQSSTVGPFIATLDGVDLQMTGGKAITGNFNSSGLMQFVNCKFTSGYTLGTPATPSGGVQDFIITDTSGTGYNQMRNTYQGTLTTSTTIYNNATDGVTPISWKIVTTGNANPQAPFECFPIVQWAAAGTYAATKVFMTSATGSLTTADAWVDVEYLGSSYTLASPATTLGAGSGTTTKPQIPQGTTPGAIDTASASWAVGGAGTNYDLQVPSFTTSAAGYVRFMVKIGKPSLTIYVDPAVTVA